jgi:hypothetical protein
MRTNFGFLTICLVGVFLHGCGGGGSATTTDPCAVSITNPAPSISSVSKVGVVAFANYDGKLVIAGRGFDSHSVVHWGSHSLRTNCSDTNDIQATVPLAFFNNLGEVAVTVVNPTPGGGTSNTYHLTIDNAVPGFTSVQPRAVETGTGTTTITVYGDRFAPGSLVMVNGARRTTHYISESELTAQLPANDFSQAGNLAISVFTGRPAGGSSQTRPLPVGAYGLVVIQQFASGFAWDATDQLLYMSVPNFADVNPNSVVAMDPFTMQIVKTQPTASRQPAAMALSDDDKFLYVSEWNNNDFSNSSGVIERFTTPDLESDIHWSLGTGALDGLPLAAYDLQVAPATPHTIAVVLTFNQSSELPLEGVTIFDDATPRVNSQTGFPTNSVQWGVDATTLYIDYGNVTALTIDASGVASESSASPTVAGNIHFDPANLLIYDDYGRIEDPASLIVTNLKNPHSQFSEESVVDIVSNRIIYVTNVPGSTLESPETEVDSYDLTTHALVAKLQIPILAPVGPVVLWGTKGLAFASGAEVVLVTGSFIN